ncbi:polysaccharide transporter [Lacticaseibacillus paracasei subsp. paracasei Lpp227]|nr:polysaccharide transporter [Lacticaseibacillus paracasei subsp. paracasei Lpp227]
MSKIKTFLRDVSYTFSSNLISLAISTLVVLIVPKFISVHQYGYWQLYVFYTTYVGILHFGWLDGIYLRYGGDRYQDLDKPLFFSQFIEFTLFEIIFAAGIIAIATLFENGQQQFVWIMTAIAMILMNLRQFFLYILQDTGRIREYAWITSSGRIVYFVIAVLELALGVRNFRPLIFADLLGSLTSVIFGVKSCPEIVFQKLTVFKTTFPEIWANVVVGIKLVLANFASSLIIGVVRYGIKIHWGVTVFGKISLTLNISNLLMTFISAVSLVLYPLFRRMDETNLRRIYPALRDVLMSMMLFLLLAYYPISWILPIWLPKYRTALSFMGLLFPMCVYSGKFSLLIATLLKTFRLEKKLLLTNVATLLFSLMLSGISIFMISNLTLVMVSIVVVLSFQSSLGEFFLTKYFGYGFGKKIIYESGCVAGFMISNYLIGGVIGFACYLAILSIYLFINRHSISRGVHLLIPSD